MKKILGFLAVSIALLVTSSCTEEGDGPEEGVIWDTAPTGVIIKIVDEADNNLLDPNVEGNWVGEDMFITYKDEEYPVDWEWDGTPVKTRMIMPYFSGLTWTGNLRGSEEKDYWLNFGEFSGEGRHDLSLTFHIPELDTNYVFKYTHEVIWKKHEPHVNDHIIYDRRELEGNTLTLVLPQNK